MTNKGSYKKIKPCGRCGKQFAAIGQKNASGKVMFEEDYCSDCNR